MTLGELQRIVTQRLRSAGLETPDLDARLLMMHAAGYDAADMIIHNQDVLPVKLTHNIESLVDRRASGEPVDHILGYREFFGRRFKVTKDVLSPRPETEGLVEQALLAVKELNAPSILDLGTGSGAIIISILAESEGAIGMGVDISDKALAIARENADAHDVDRRVTFSKGSWFETVSEKYDIIVSNPPYITDEAMGGLSQEVVNYDPDIALRGGATGLEPYDDIIKQARTYLNAPGLLMLEIGFDQGKAVLDLMRGEKYHNILLMRDLSGHDRIVIGQIN